MHLEPPFYQKIKSTCAVKRGRKRERERERERERDKRKKERRNLKGEEEEENFFKSYAIRFCYKFNQSNKSIKVAFK